MDQRIDLSHWNLTDTFDLFDVASLAHGFEPKAKHADADKAKIEATRGLLSSALLLATAECAAACSNLYELQFRRKEWGDTPVVSTFTFSADALPSIDLHDKYHKVFANFFLEEKPTPRRPLSTYFSGEIFRSIWVKKYLRNAAEEKERREFFLFRREDIARFFAHKGFKSAFPFAKPEPELAGAKLTAWNLFDEDDPCYPRELDIAFQAWTAVRKNPGENTKDQLKAWLDQSGYGLPPTAIERIATICNWDRSGGRPKKE